MSRILGTGESIENKLGRAKGHQEQKGYKPRKGEEEEKRKITSRYSLKDHNKFGCEPNRQ